MQQYRELNRRFACIRRRQIIVANEKYCSVFSRCLNVLSVAADVTETGRLFHNRAAATGKARSPTVERRVGGTTRALVVADRSRRRVSRVETVLLYVRLFVAKTDNVTLEDRDRKNKNQIKNVSHYKKCCVFSSLRFGSMWVLKTFDNRFWSWFRCKYLQFNHRVRN